MLWELPPPWDIILIIAIFAVVSVFVFWNYFSLYQRRYFSGKALQLTLVKTVAWLMVYGGSFVIVFWLVSLALAPGFTRYLVGGGIWWLLSHTLLAFGWGILNQVLDTLFG